MIRPRPARVRSGATSSIPAPGCGWSTTGTRVSKALSLTWATVVETSHALAGSGRRGSDATWLLVVPDSERSVRRIRVDQVREVAGEVGVYPVINDRERRLLAYGPRSCEAAREAERQIADYVQRQIADYAHGAARDA